MNSNFDKVLLEFLHKKSSFKNKTKESKLDFFLRFLAYITFVEPKMNSKVQKYRFNFDSPEKENQIITKVLEKKISSDHLLTLELFNR